MRTFIRRLFSAAAMANITLAALLVSITGAGIASAQTQFRDSVRNDFAAASLLAKIRLHGERMRRYEKEFFIYLTAPAKRANYANEHAEAYKKLLEDVDTALMPSSRAFTDAERERIMQWKQDAIFYVSEFSKLVADARELPADPPNASALVIQYNERIKAGKDRFASLLTGSGEMRVEKERSSLEAAQAIEQTFKRLIWVVMGVVGIGGIAVQLLLNMPRRSRTAAPTTTMRANAVPPKA